MHNEINPSSKRLSEASDSRNRSGKPEKRPQKNLAEGSQGLRVSFEPTKSSRYIVKKKYTMSNEITPSSRRLNEASGSRNRSGSAGKRHLLFTSDRGKSVDESHLIDDTKQLYDEESLKDYLGKNSFKKDDFSTAGDEIAKSLKYDHLAKLDFLPAYYIYFEAPSPLIGENIAKFKILQSWKKNNRQPHHDFATRVLDTLYKRHEPPWMGS